MSPSTKDSRDTLDALFGPPAAAQRKRARLAEKRVAVLMVGEAIEELADAEQALRRTHDRLLLELKAATKGRR